MRKPYRLHRFGHSTVVTIPVTVLRELKWQPGEEVFVEHIDGRIVVTDVPRRLKDLAELNIRTHLGLVATKK